MRLGIVGIGRIAQDYVGIICASKISGLQLTALCSRSDRRVTELRKQFTALEQTAYFADYDQMLSSGLIDAVLICTPHGQHPLMTIKALEAGIHVLTEKPVGIFGTEIDLALETLSKYPNLVCGVMYNRRASPAFQYIKSILDTHNLGELVRCTWLITNLYRTDAYYRAEDWRGSWRGEGGGLLMTQASHQLDLMQWLCGMPESVLARCFSVERPIITENEVEMLFTYPNGAHGQFISSARECPGTNLLEICCTKGRISIREDREIEIIQLQEDERFFAKTCGSPFEKVAGSKQHILFDESSNVDQQTATIQNFVDAVYQRCPVQCPLAEGYRSLQIIHGAYMSHWHKAEVELPVNEDEFQQMLNMQEKTFERKE